MERQIGNEKKLVHAQNSLNSLSYSTDAFAGSIRRYGSLGDFLSSFDFSDGLHTIGFGSYNLDLLVTNSHKFKSNSSFFVGLTGAVSNRKGKKAPFFSGGGIANELDLPMISISDPAMAINPDISLAWYAGFKEWNDLAYCIADLVERFSLKNKLIPIFFGGSGGGFASLSILSYMTIKAKAFIWNPQTSISSYAKKFVSEYISTSFGISNSSRSDYEILEDLNVNHDLTKAKFSDNVEIYYVQNLSDWHYVKHSLPFLESQHCEFRYSVCKENISFFLLDYGGGHNPLDKDAIKACLPILNRPRTQTENFLLISDYFKSNEYNLIDEASQKLVEPEISSTLLTESKEGITAKITMKNEAEASSYSFYLIKDGTVIEKVFYRKSRVYSFPINNVGSYVVQCFAHSHSRTSILKTNELKIECVDTVKRVVILGSCVTRDLFQLPSVSSKFSIKNYYARSSLQSIFSSKRTIDKNDLDLKSEFQKNKVLEDFLCLFKAEDLSLVDFVIIDFIDERFKLVEFLDGSKVTLSTELSASGYLDRFSRQEDFNIVENDLNEWKKACRLFVNFISESDAVDKIILHQAYWKKSYVTNSGCIEKFSDIEQTEIEKQNMILEERYEYLKSLVPNIRVILVDKYMADKSHVWGLAPYHYEEDYYLEVAKLLLNIKK